MEDRTAPPGGTELRVLGPGGPYEAVRECCASFEERTKIRVLVRKGRPDLLAEEARASGDVLYSGAESMMEEFERSFPGIVDHPSIRCPCRRRIGILVRPGNPRGIRGLSSLAADGVGLLAVELEGMEGFFGLFAGIPANIRRRVVTGEEGFEAWRSGPALDAWVTYRSWFVRLEDGTQFVEMEDVAGRYRGTPLALTQTTRKPVQAGALLDFLSGEAARAIFRKWGWE